MIWSIYSTGSDLIWSFSRDIHGNTLSNSRVKAGMVSTASLPALIFIWTGIAAKLVVPPCDKHMFDSDVDHCVSDFNRSMETGGFQDGCPWPAAKGIYNKLKLCVDEGAKASWCRGQGFLLDKAFLEVHYKYFWQCGQVQDPPLSTLIMLIAPVIIITLLMPILCVKLTTWSTEMPSSLAFLKLSLCEWVLLSCVPNKQSEK
ncbi:uncharacterized protein LOC132987069 isoform X2 [Labrus mixtus]|uniref:uncharacterized protein LOC132987069 isoform X2 n=1 Tax=Labrus mixtus TaxID=508554 RepID=UPI0029BFD213|nr:uncharacterized protein LOC132987069 isoform X2 [Labrus mixtus]